MPKLLEGMYRIGHNLFDDAIFLNSDDAEKAARSFCRFLIAKAGADEATIEVLRYATDEDSDGRVVTDWWHYKTVCLRLVEEDEE
jgi:hypothetical protein